MTHRFSAWSQARERLSGRPLTWMTLLFGGNLVAALVTHRKATATGRLFREGVALMVGMAAVAFVVCALAQTPPDVARSLYAFQALCDLLLIADAGWVAEVAFRKVRGRRTDAARARAVA